MREPSRRPRTPVSAPVRRASGPAGRPRCSKARSPDARIVPQPAKAKLAEVIERSKALLGMPADYRLGILPASDTGAFEAAMWSMLGARGIDIVAFESFGNGWLTDARKQLQLEDLRAFEAGYGELPELSAIGSDRDIVFTWNGTTSGVRVPDADWIAADRQGLTFCDATSAAFAMPLAWTSSTWSPGLGRRCSAAKHSMACSPFPPVRWNGSRPTCRPGRSPRSSG